MSTQGRPPEEDTWREFILQHGFRASGYELAFILGCSQSFVDRVRQSCACAPRKTGLNFVELFSLWHGRAPSEADWPIPRKLGASGAYEWLAPEDALLATLVGQISVDAIAATLTARLQAITRDPDAIRTKNAAQVRINKIGLQSSDVVGGITIAEAAKETNSIAVIHQAVDRGELQPFRIGRLFVIPHDAWAEWKSKRTFPPEGFVLLSTLKEPLAVRSDKLSEFSRMGYVPTAIRCNPYGTKGPNTQFGTWYIAKNVAETLVADRRAGRPMPWHGKPLLDNLKKTYTLWQNRQHPAACKTCADIWGPGGPPATFDDYLLRYPPLAHGAKRHLTMPWVAGITIAQVVAQASCSEDRVRAAIRNGALAVHEYDGVDYVTRTDATRWIARHCPDGEGKLSWIALDTAVSTYLFSLADLRKHVTAGTLLSKTGTAGAARGVVYVPRQQVAQLRERIGFTEAEAARRVGVTVPRLRRLLEGVDWRGAEGIPLVTVQAVIKRLESVQGYSLESAATILGRTLQWVKDRIKDGTAKVARAPWDERRLYLTEPMMKRLRAVLDAPVKAWRPGPDWLRLSEAAQEAGVTGSTLLKWVSEGSLYGLEHQTGTRYHRGAVRARARKYWTTVRFHRAVPPAWLQSELDGIGPT